MMGFRIVNVPRCFIKAGSDCPADFCAEEGVQAGAYPLRYVTVWPTQLCAKTSSKHNWFY